MKLLSNDIGYISVIKQRGYNLISHKNNLIHKSSCDILRIMPDKNSKKSSRDKYAYGSTLEHLSNLDNIIKDMVKNKQFCSVCCENLTF